jgi:hypothetical protein
MAHFALAGLGAQRQLALEVFRGYVGGKAALFEKVQRVIFGWLSAAIQHASRIEENTLDHLLGSVDRVTTSTTCIKFSTTKSGDSVSASCSAWVVGNDFLWIAKSFPRASSVIGMAAGEL